MSDTAKKPNEDLDSVTARINSLMGKSASAEEAADKVTEAEAPKGDAAAGAAASGDAAKKDDDAKKGEEKSAAAPAPPAPSKESNDANAGSLRESSYEVAVTLSDQQADPNSPLYSVKSFDQLGLTEELLKGIYSMKYQKPSKIQERALPLLLQNPPKNMIGQSQSGTGKTAAFVLTMLSRVDFSLDAPQAIALAPSRELARQIMDVVQEMGKYTNVKTQFAIPDAVPPKTKIDAQIIVGTPGKTFDLIKKKSIDTKNIKVFVLDEADNMLDQQGLGEQSIRVKKCVRGDRAHFKRARGRG